MMLLRDERRLGMRAVYRRVELGRGNGGEQYSTLDP
jgi:hypothetical protein